jgi:nucleoporin POM152
MSATPRMRYGGYPQTPGTAAPPPAARNRDASPTPAAKPKPRSSLPPAPENVNPAAAASQPRFELVDAPTQRFWACAIYTALWAFRLFDWLQVYEDNGGSFYFFTKWVFIDFIYLFTLPWFRIPWLELSSPTVVTLFFVHFFINWILMFNIPVPFQSWLLAALKVFYDRELSISEHSVKVSNILHNSSLIMGKQIINILPEG